MWRERLQVVRHDAALAVRTLARTPGLALAAALTLALGVGATVTMFDLVDRLLFRPPALVQAPGELRRVYVATAEHANGPDDAVSYPGVVALREAITVIPEYGLTRADVRPSPPTPRSPPPSARASRPRTRA